MLKVFDFSLLIFAKSFILDIRLTSEYASCEKQRKVRVIPFRICRNYFFYAAIHMFLSLLWTSK